MSVIVDVSLPADEFALGRILDLAPDARVSLETLVPMGERAIPFFRLYDGSREAFETAVRGHRLVEDIQMVSTHDEETLYAMDWDVAEDDFFATLRAVDANLLEASGTTRSWSFELRFPDHDAVASFQDRAVAADIPITVERLYNPTKPEAGPWYGLTPSQHEMLVRAVEAGYYAIPRGISTKALADEFDISDQAVTERLRRAVATLTRNSLLADEDSD